MELNIYFAVAFFEKFAGPNDLKKVFRFFLSAAKFVQILDHQRPCAALCRRDPGRIALRYL